jgi:hypothetical protein
LIDQDYTVHPDETVSEVVLVFGSLKVEGRVQGDVVVIFGKVEIAATGVIDGDLVNVGGGVDVAGSHRPVGEFENFGVMLGPLAGGLVWSAFNIQAAFVTYGVASVLMALVALVTVSGRGRRAKIEFREESHDRQPDRV